MTRSEKNEHISGNTWHKITVQKVKCSVVKDGTVNFTFFDAQLIFRFFSYVKSAFPFSTSQLVLLFLIVLEALLTRSEKMNISPVILGIK